MAYRFPVSAERARLIHDQLTEIGQRSADEGVPLGYHHHMGALGESPDVRTAVSRKPRSMERRDLIRWLAATAGVHAVQAFAPAELLAFGRAVHRGAGSGSGLRRFGHVQRTVLIAAERILPGATEANVGIFIDKMLADWHSPEERARLLAGLDDLDARCRASAGSDFVNCAEAEQVAVLTSLDNEVTALRAGPGNERANQHWFAMLKFLTVYGWCTSEMGMRALRLYPLPSRYDGCAPA